MTDAPTVHLVDDDAEILASLITLFDAHGYRCAAYPSGRAFLASVRESMVGCAVVDVRMPEIDGLTVVEELERRGGRLPVILMTGHGDVPLAVRAMKAGAIDFVEKPCRFAELRESVERGFAISERRRLAGPSALDASRLVALLTPREREVFDRLVAGDANKAIARRLGISARTVEIHRARVLEKLAARGLPDLVRVGLAAAAAAPPARGPDVGGDTENYVSH